MDQRGLNDLISLDLESCNEMECLIDSTQQHVSTTTFSNLVNLSLQKMTNLREIWKEPTQHVNLQRLINVKVSNCGRLTYLFSSSLARSLVQLQRLKIADCEGFEQIINVEKEEGEILIEAHLQPFCFSKLITLKIINCEKLEYIFPISIARGLRQLEKLRILDCPQLKQVFSSGKEEDVLVGNGNDIELPNLREIELERLSSLTSFSESNYHWMWPSLQELSVVKCPNWMTSFITDLEASLKPLKVLHIEDHIELHKLIILLQNLEELTIENWEGIENCEGIEEVFHSISSVSNVKKLKLYDLSGLKVIWKGPTQISCFQNLTEIHVSNCNKLMHIFSRSLARNLPRLAILWIKGCEELERIIGEEDKDEEDQIISFPNLKKIYVIDCNKLKSLFPITIARGLPQLKTLCVERVSQLEEVFSHENEEDVKDEKKIMLPQLYCLSLHQLPRVISFCQGGYHFIFPSLNRLLVKDCPNIITSFAIASDGPVHAKDKDKAEKSYVVDESDEDEDIEGVEVKVEEEVEEDEIIESDIKLKGEIQKPVNAPPHKTPQLVKEDLQEGSSTTQAVVATTPSGSDIDWWRWGPNTLPPYMEESSGNL